jgi:hypothetical protein
MAIHQTWTARLLLKKGIWMRHQVLFRQILLMQQDLLTSLTISDKGFIRAVNLCPET